MALWVAGRYRLAMLVALVTFLTFEIFPVFPFLVGVFFLSFYVEKPIRRYWRALRRAYRAPRTLRGPLLTPLRDLLLEGAVVGLPGEPFL